MEEEEKRAYLSLEVIRGEKVFWELLLQTFLAREVGEGGTAASWSAGIINI